MFVVLTCKVSLVQGEAYWTYYPTPPTLVPVTWEDKPLMVWVNDSAPLGGKTKHIQPQ